MNTMQIWYALKIGEDGKNKTNSKRVNGRESFESPDQKDEQNEDGEVSF